MNLENSLGNHSQTCRMFQQQTQRPPCMQLPWEAWGIADSYLQKMLRREVEKGQDPIVAESRLVEGMPSKNRIGREPTSLQRSHIQLNQATTRHQALMLLPNFAFTKWNELLDFSFTNAHSILRSKPKALLNLLIELTRSGSQSYANCATAVLIKPGVPSAHKLDELHTAATAANLYGKTWNTRFKLHLHRFVCFFVFFISLCFLKAWLWKEHYSSVLQLTHRYSVIHCLTNCWKTCKQPGNSLHTMPFLRVSTAMKSSSSRLHWDACTWWETAWGSSCQVAHHFMSGYPHFPTKVQGRESVARFQKNISFGITSQQLSVNTQLKNESYECQLQSACCLNVVWCVTVLSPILPLLLVCMPNISYSATACP